MDYNTSNIEQRWKKFWEENNTYKVPNNSDKPKYYVLDMFPYPSGSGLHVGHPLGYIASDIFARYKRLKGFNVLHPMGYDAFGLPAEQYAIQTGVHPAKSTADNIARYRSQLDNIGFSFDWSREVQTCDPKYYKWTQWIFLQLFEHGYDNQAQKAKPVSEIIAHFEANGSAGLDIACSEELSFTKEDWAGYSAKEKDDVLMNYRLAYRKTTFVNWCEELGTVLANDEVKDGVSERGGYPVERKPMLQWSLRITAYAERLLNDLESLEWSDSMKKMQGNWIGRSTGAQMFFDLDGHDKQIEIYTTRPDTIFGATFMVLAPEHDLVAEITTADQKAAIGKYLEYVNTRSERDRMSETKEVTGEFTGAYAINPFNGAKVPVYIAEYVLKDYGTGAIMAVPADDERDQRFAEKFGIEVIQIIDKSMYPGATIEDKKGKMINSDFLNGMEVMDAIKAINSKLEEMGIGKAKVNYRLRDAIYSRQRYWGEPFPVYYDKDGVTHAMNLDELPLELPESDDFRPASGAKAPLARLTDWVNLPDGATRETDTMPGFAGSSWYFLRYMDAMNDEAFASQKALNYWQDVDLYIGGTEHAVGHLMYSRFWHKFLFDKGLVPTNEPFKKLVNQGMIQGVILKLIRVFFIKEDQWHKNIIKNKSTDRSPFERHLVWVNIDVKDKQVFIHPTEGKGYLLIPHGATPDEIPFEFGTLVGSEYRLYKKTLKLARDRNDGNAIRLNLVLDTDIFDWQKDENEEEFLPLGYEWGKMSKSKYNVINPDDMVEKYGADCFRMYEMFLGPIEQSKPWDTKGIDGVSKFLRKFWMLFVDDQGNSLVQDAEPTKDEFKILHTCIKKVNADIERFSFNTCVASFMVCVNELRSKKCHKKAILEELVVLLAPFAPFITEELWHQLGNETSVHTANYPKHHDKYLVEDTVTYPVCINGKKRAIAEFSADASKDEMEKFAKAMPEMQKWFEGKTIRKVIVVPKRMINIVVG